MAKTCSICGKPVYTKTAGNPEIGHMHCAKRQMVKSMYTHHQMLSAIDRMADDLNVEYAESFDRPDDVFYEVWEDDDFVEAFDDLIDLFIYLEHRVLMNG